MRRFFTAAMTAAALLTLSAFAHGQDTSENQAPMPSSKVNLSLEQEHIIKEIVKDMRVEPAGRSAPETVGRCRSRCRGAAANSAGHR